MRRRVVVTGMGVVTPLGCKVEEMWTRLCRGESGVRPITGFDVSIFKVRFGGEIPDWNPVGYIDGKEQRRIDRFAQYALVAATDAIRESGLDFSKEDPRRCASVIGSGVGGLGEIEAQFRRLMEKGPDRVSAFTIPKMMLNAAAGCVSIQYGLKGPAYGVVTACASASNAVVEAIKEIESGDIDVAITGGSEAAVTPLGIAGFAAMKALSERNDDPQRASRPFDRDRDGFVLSEGAGIVVLEEYEHARKRAAPILAEMLGYGVSSDAGHITQPDENGRGAASAMSDALASAGLNKDQIDYINAHGTSTPLGDVAETIAVKSVFGEQARSVPISSTKSQLGHLLGASGGVELVISILAIRNGVIPPTINLENPDPACDLDYTPNVARERRVRMAMSNSFGFGGHNVSLIVGEARNGSA
ncbi:MAG: beta-ketoacyl-ACP synthase II [Thermogutta sp.]